MINEKFKKSYAELNSVERFIIDTLIFFVLGCVFLFSIIGLIEVANFIAESEILGGINSDDGIFSKCFLTVTFLYMVTVPVWGVGKCISKILLLFSKFIIKFSK